MKILIVEDEPNVASLLHRNLLEYGHTIGIATDGYMGLDQILTNKFDLVLLDIMLPKKSGLEILRELKDLNNNTPVILLTALDTTDMVVQGLDLGADDYISKPFKMEEVVARINAVKRRTAISEIEEPFTLEFKGIHLDDTSKKVFKDGKEIKLTATEYNLLKVLLSNINKVLSREKILDKVWGVQYDLGTNVVDVYINYLRKKLGDTSSNRIIHTVIGMGYVIR
ncbi:response regulator transcription factor [Antarcticibacterium arcticum]|uniref:Response regulator transcription factor n=1 Tax=Antarcticibacterium arcticum TaxID=2585771 RepID=A0A5B8YGJ9_9FLAO|nr:response regulator transcription factor [Antarcticibacterium arcticum]QED36904.1 response regulator transcription factor [Antarcticibacterium arcticum]